MPASAQSSIDAVETRTVFAEWAARRPGEVRSLPRARAVIDAVGLDLSSLPPVLAVVGSKGKGTTVAHASAALAAAGLRVGTIQSPGATSNLDRIRVDGLRVSEGEYTVLLERVDAARRTLPAPSEGYLSPTGFFTIAGFRHLVDADCDVIVAEAGLGGRSDELSLFPSVGVAVAEVFLEHRAQLGDSIREIARDKAGVAGQATRTISYLAQSAEAESEIGARAAEIGARLDRIARADSLTAMNVRLGQAAASALLRDLDRPALDARTLAEAAARVVYPGRLSTHRTPTGRVIVDSAISRAGLANALAFADAVFDAEPDAVLVSVGSEKDLAGFVDELAPLGDRSVFIDIPGIYLSYPPRSAWPYAWADAAELPTLLHGDVLAVGTVSFTSHVLRMLGVEGARLF